MQSNSNLPPPFGYCPTKPKGAHGRPTPTLLLALCALVINRQHLTHQHRVDLSHVQLHQRSPSSTSVCCCVAKIITLCSTSGRVCACAAAIRSFQGSALSRASSVRLLSTQPYVGTVVWILRACVISFTFLTNRNSNTNLLYNTRFGIALE